MVSFKAVAIALGASLLLYSCGKTPSGAAESSPTKNMGRPAANSQAAGTSGAAVPVTTTRVAKKPMAVTIPAVGTVEAVSTVQIKSQVTGQLTSIDFKEGDEVQRGHPLFTIDPRPFEAALEQARAALARDTATSTNQQAEQARYTDLFQRGIMSREQYDAQIAAAKASQATVEVDEAAVDAAQLNLRFTRITAPIAGKTGSLGVHAGDLVRADDTSPMVVINQVSPIYVTFSVPGRYLADIRKYQSQQPLAVRVLMQSATLPGAQPSAPSVATPDQSPDAQAGAAEDGTLTFIDNAVDPATGTIKLRASFKNADRALWPGLFAQVTLNLTTDPNALVVPAIAVQPSQDGQFVYVITPDRTAQMRSVTVARQQGNEIVIAKGLSAGEEVVTDGQLRLTPGAHVSVAHNGGQPEDE